MKSNGQDKLERREFLRSLGRWATGGTMALMSVTFAKRRQRLAADNCINKSICCDCSRFSGCRLPAAISAKQAQKNVQQGGMTNG